VWRNRVSDAELILPQVLLETKEVAPVGLKRIVRQPAFDPKLAEIPFKQRIQQWCRSFRHGRRVANYSELAS
jgi:hypothetical protein